MRTARQTRRIGKPPRNGPLETRRVRNGSGPSGNSSCDPALLSAIADKAKQKTITRALITAVLETITMRDDDLTTWCGPIAKLPTDRFAAALLMALREQFSKDRLSLFAKGLRTNVVALCKRLKADKPDEPAS